MRYLLRTGLLSAGVSGIDGDAERESEKVVIMSASSVGHLLSSLDERRVFLMAGVGVRGACEEDGWSPGVNSDNSTAPGATEQTLK